MVVHSGVGGDGGWWFVVVSGSVVCGGVQSCVVVYGVT